MAAEIMSRNSLYPGLRPGTSTRRSFAGPQSHRTAHLKQQYEGPEVGAVSKTPESRKASGAPEPKRSGVRVSAQALQPLAQCVDLTGRPILRRTFPILGKLGAPQSRVTLRAEVGDLHRRIGGIGGRRQPRRGLQKPIHALRACSNTKAGPQLLADLDAARRAVRLPQFLDDRDDGIVRNLLRSSHEGEGYGKLR
jgi:hypothetical protein